MCARARGPLRNESDGLGEPLRIAEARPNKQENEGEGKLDVSAHDFRDRVNGRAI